MAEKIQTISPIGRLNSDDSLENMPSGDCRERWHAEISESGKYGKITNIKGTLEWDLGLSATQQAIGACYDYKNEQFIFIVSDTANLTTGTVISLKNNDSDPFYTKTTLFTYSNLFENFTSSALATSTYVDCKMMGDVLLLVDGINENKAIDIVKAEDITDGTIYKKTTLSVTIDNTNYSGLIKFVASGSVTQISANDYIYVDFKDWTYDSIYGGVYKVQSRSISGGYTSFYVNQGVPLPDVTLSVSSTIYKYVDSSTLYDIKDESVSMIVPTPRYAPEVESVYDISLEDSSIDATFGVYQFAISFVYYNDAESLLSPFSKESADNEMGFVDSNGTTVNAIRLTILLDRPNIKRLKIYARKIYESVSDFYLIEEINRENIVGNTYLYNFYGEMSSISTGNVDAFTIQDSVPYKSESLDIVKENVVALGGNTEGYEIINTTATLSYDVDIETGDYTQIGSDLTNTSSAATTLEIFGDSSGQVTNLVLSGESNSNTDNGYLWYSISTSNGKFILYKDSSFSVGSAVAQQILLGTGSQPLNELNSSGLGGTFDNSTTSLVNVQGIIRTDIGDFSNFDIVNTGSDNFIKVGLFDVVADKRPIYIPMLANSNNDLASFVSTSINDNSFAGLSSVSGNTVTVSLPTGSTALKAVLGNYYREKPYSYGGFSDDTTHLFIQNFYDKYGRLKYVSDIKKLQIPYLISSNPLITDYRYGRDTVFISFDLTNDYPTDCETFSIAKARPTKSWKQFITAYYGIWDATQANANYDYDADATKAGLYAIAIEQTTTGYLYSSYEFTQGDTIRIVGYNDSVNHYTILKYKDIIKGVTTSNDGHCIVLVDSTLISEFMTSISGTDMDDSNALWYIFEIYNKNDSVTNTIEFLECTQRYLVADFNFSNPLEIYNGDMFGVKIGTTGVDYYKTPKLFQTSIIDTRQYGKPIGRDESSTIRYFNSVRNGGKAFQNTSINNLFRFNYDDVIYVNDNYGTIKRIASSGNTLRVYQENKTASIYIGGTEIANQDGSTQIIRADKTLGSYRYSDDDYGLQIKTAFVDTGKEKYFWDINRGVIVRDSNGMIPITGRVSTGDYSNDFKMERFFKGSSKLVTSKLNYVVSLGYNEDNQTLFVTNTSYTAYPTVCFSKEHGFWFTFIDFKPKFYIHGGLLSLIIDSASEQSFCLYNDNADRCLMAGVQKDFSFQVVPNENGKLVKTFEAITLDASEAIGCEIEIEPTSSYSNGMKSRIKRLRWRLEEGLFRADVLRNMWTTSGKTETAYDLYKGDLMRGKAAKVTFTAADSTDPIEVLSVDVYYSDSSN